MKTFKTKKGTTTWVRVSRDYPCPICGKADWCAFNMQQTKAVCMRQIDHSLPSFMGGTLYTLTGGAKVDFSHLEVSEGEKLAPAYILHKVYSLVIATFGLTKEHIVHLKAERGLTAEQIALRGYASATKATHSRQVAKIERDKDGKIVSIQTIWEDLFEKNGLPRDAWVGVPGFSYDEQMQAPCFNAAFGILIPCRNDWGQIVGMQVRLDDSEIKTYATIDKEFESTYRVSVKKAENGFNYRVYTKENFEVVCEGTTTEHEVFFDNGFSFKIKTGPKYVFVSSSGKTRGTSAKSVPHFAFPDNVLAQAKFDEQGKSRVYLMGKVDKVIVTEGLLKGDIIASVAPTSRLAPLGSVLVVAMAGVSSWKPVADKIIKYKFEEAYLAFDQDFVENDSVFDRLDDMVHYLTFDKGLVSSVLTWETGKGLDDFLLSEASETETIKIKSYTKD